MSTAAHARPREVDLAVLVNGFPRLSETFVLQELLHLERIGLRLRVIALSQPHEAVEQEGLAELRASVEYVAQQPPGGSRLAVRAAHAALLFQRGTRYLAAAAELLSTPLAAGAAPSTRRLDRGALLAVRLLRMGSPPLYVHFAHKPASVGRAAALLAGVPYALSCHAKDIWETPPRELAAKVRDAEIVLTCTEEGREQLELLAGAHTPVRLVRHGVDVETVAPREPTPGPPRILAVGRLVQKKGFDVLIEAAQLLEERGVAFTVRIVGEGVEWPHLQRMVHERALSERVTFLGPLTPAEVRSEYARAQLLCAPCRMLPSGDRDGLPNVVLEAMAHRLPVVATSLRGICEAIEDGRSGLIVPPDDPPALARALERVLAQDELAQRLGRTAAVCARAQFDRRGALPGVPAALVAAGLIAPARAAAPPLHALSARAA